MGALARLHLDHVVQTAYVQEAYRLLKKSIIRVETEDITLDDDDLDNNIYNIDGNNNPTTPQHHSPHTVDEVLPPQPQSQPETINTHETTIAPQQPPATKKRKTKTKITLEQYETISNTIALHLRSLEEENEPSQYLKWKEIVNWYLLQQEETVG